MMLCFFIVLGFGSDTSFIVHPDMMEVKKGKQTDCKKISVVGGIILDIKALASEKPVMHSYVPGQVSFSAGGVARNIAENLARLEVPVRLFGMVGKDEAGQRLIRDTARAEVDVSGIVQDPELATAQDVSIFDEEGDLLVAVTAVETMSQLSAQDLAVQAEALFDADYLVVDTNLSLPCLQYLLTEANDRNIPFVIDPVSVPFTAKVNQLSGEIFLATPNEREAEALARPVDKLLITRGKRGVVWVEKETEQSFSVPLQSRPASTVGAGDAFLAGTLAALARGKKMKTAIAWGNAAAGITLRSSQAVSPDLNLQNLVQTLKA
jgi:pseudouridine kinase